METTFEDLKEHLTKEGFTMSPNDLDDIFLRELPPEYYCFWRFIWRKTFGWQKIADSLSLRDIAKGAGINVSVVSRAAWFFHITRIIRYAPGTKGQQKSRFRIFPDGLLEADDLNKLMRILHVVLANEKRYKSSDRNFHFTNAEFTQQLVAAWKGLGGQVAGPPVVQVEERVAA